MRLRELRSNSLTIVAMCDERGGCPIADALVASANQPGGRQMLSILHHASVQGPPQSKQKCRHLEDGIWEFKAIPRNGRHLRILWFYSGVRGQEIVCTNWFVKGCDLKKEKRKAKEQRRRYTEAQQQGVEFELVRCKEENGSDD